MAAPAGQRPIWRVMLDGRDISGHIAPRLMSLGITSQRDQDADQLDLAVSDHDGRLALPRAGVTVDVALGWAGGGVIDMGTFIVDEVEHAGTPDHVTVRGRSAPLSQPMRQKRDQSWHDTSVGDMVRVIAGRNRLTPRCAASLADKPIPHWDQTNESDINLLTRIGKQWDAVATVKGGCLIFAPIGKGVTATGAQLPGLVLHRSDGDQHRYHVAKRETYTGVRAWWHDVDGAKKKAAIAGDEKALKTLRQTYASKADALQAAKAEWQRLQRGEATFNLQLARGHADAAPEMALSLHGWGPIIDGTGWLIKQVKHRLDDGGFTTSIEAETGGGGKSD